MPHVCASLPCRFTLHGLLLKQDTVPYTALCPGHLCDSRTRRIWHEQRHQVFPSALPFLSCLCGQAETSLWSEKSCKIQPSIWSFAWMWLKMLVQTLRRSELDLRAPFCLWGRNIVVHQESGSPPMPEWSGQHSFIAHWQAAPGLALLGRPGGSSAHSLWQWPRAQASRRAQTQRETDSTASLSPAMPQGGISELPPSGSPCLPISIPPE